MPILELQDVSLYYEFDNSNSRPALVLAHSLGTANELWSEQVEAFSKHFSVLRYDLRGHGRSSAPPGPYSIDQMGADVIALLDSLHIDAAHFCGISIGGLVGQWLGVHAPQRLRKLVLSNTAARIGSIENWNQRIATVQSGGIDPIVSTVLKGWFTEGFRQTHPEVIGRMESLLRSNRPEGYIACCAVVRDADLRNAVHRIAAPTLVIYGTEDRSTTADEARFLLDEIAGSQELSLPAAHISNIEAADAFTAGVLQFLRES